jgi:hypothetical protein
LLQLGDPFVEFAVVYQSLRLGKFSSRVGRRDTGDG